MQIDFALAELKGNGWMSAKVIQLGTDIFLCRFDEAIVAFESNMVLAHQASGGFGLSHPFFDGR